MNDQGESNHVEMKSILTRQTNCNNRILIMCSWGISFGHLGGIASDLLYNYNNLLIRKIEINAWNLPNKNVKLK